MNTVNGLPVILCLLNWNAKAIRQKKTRIRETYTKLTESQKVDSLSPEEKSAVDCPLYKGNDKINGYLRGVGYDTSAVRCVDCPALDSAIAKTVVPKQRYAGSANRRRQFALKPGAVIEDKAFVSTSLNAKTSLSVL